MTTVVGDVGKSNIRLAVLAEGAVSRSVEFASPAALGEDSESLYRSIAAAFAQLDITGDALEVGLGVAGFARSATSGDLLAAAIADVAVVNRLVIASDVVVAHLGAFGGDEGTVLIVGTGAAALGVEADETPVLRDGDGPRFGDDGSGGWMGAQAVRAVLQGVEGRGPATSLVDLLALRSGLDTHAMVRQGNAVDNPARWSGRFAPDVLSAWEEGDTVATGIVDTAVAALTNTVLSARRRSKAVALTGGVVGHPRFAAELSRSLAAAVPELIISIPETAPLLGARLLLELERTTVGGALQSLTSTHGRLG